MGLRQCTASYHWKCAPEGVSWRVSCVLDGHALRRQRAHVDYNSDATSRPVLGGEGYGVHDHMSRRRPYRCPLEDVRDAVLREPEQAKVIFRLSPVRTRWSPCSLRFQFSFPSGAIEAMAEDGGGQMAPLAGIVALSSDSLNTDEIVAELKGADDVQSHPVYCEYFRRQLGGVIRGGCPARAGLRRRVVGGPQRPCDSESAPSALRAASGNIEERAGVRATAKRR